MCPYPAFCSYRTYLRTHHVPLHCILFLQDLLKDAPCALILHFVPTGLTSHCLAGGIVICFVAKE